MKNLKLGLAVLTMASVASLQAQTQEVSGSDKANQRAEIATETAKKTYTFKSNDKTVENTVEVKTTQTQAIQFTKASEGQVNKDRVLDKKMISKTVRIDNDADKAFDEKINFSYRADAVSDFVLVSDADKIYLALDNGENLEVMKDKSFDKLDLLADRDTYVYTDDNGEEVEFFITRYIDIDSDKMKKNTK